MPSSSSTRAAALYTKNLSRVFASSRKHFSNSEFSINIGIKASSPQTLTSERLVPLRTACFRSPNRLATPDCAFLC